MREIGAAAYGLYPRDISLDDVVDILNRAGFGNEDICMVLSPAHPVATVVRDARFSGETPQRCALGTMDWISEFGAVIIPTVGFFIRSQRFFRSLMIDQDFPMVCGGSTTLAGLGFSESEARRLSRILTEFGTLVYVSCLEHAVAVRASELLSRIGASEAAALEEEHAAKAAA